VVVAEQTPPERGAFTAAGDDPAQRGELIVKNRVVERLATYAALSVAGVARHAAGLDRVTGRDLPRVAVSVAGGHVRAAVEIAVVWPHPLGETAASVRSRVTEQLVVLGGLTVDAVDVAVPAVVQPHSEHQPRRVQ